MPAVLAAAMAAPGEVAWAGPNIVALGNYSAVPFKRAQGRESLSGREVVFTFDDPEFDFGRVVVRSTQPASVVRRDLFVGFTGTDLRVSPESVQGSAGVQVQEVEIWLKIKGQLRPGASYEWEIERAEAQQQRSSNEAIPAVIPAYWADGEPIGVDVSITEPQRQETDRIQRLIFPHGVVTLPSFTRQTGAAWIILKPRNIGNFFGITRFTFREVDTEEDVKASAVMPIPVRYIPIRNVVEDQIVEVVERSTGVLERMQAADGSWGTGNLNERVHSTAAVALPLAELNPKNERIAQAMTWIAAQKPESNQAFDIETVCLRLMLLSRFGSMSDYGPTIQRDVEFLVDAQLDDGGWGEHSPKAPGRTDLVTSQHLYSFIALVALREARFVGAEVEQRVFRNAMRYWTEAQGIDGGFTNRLARYGSVGRPAVGFTAAGAAGLMASLDMAAGFGSKRCSGFLSSKEQLRSAEQAVQWLDEQYGDEFRGIGPLAQNTFSYFEGLWLVLFGEVSGINKLGGENYFAQEADDLLAHYDPSTGMFGIRGQGGGLGNRQGGFTEAPSLGRTALALWILGTGNAPTIVQRIIAGDDAGGWTQYRGDAAHLVRYLGRRGGTHYNWRRSDIDRDISELAEVPLMFLSVVGPVNWSDAQWNKIREYCLAGGSVVVDIAEEAVAEAQRSAILDRIQKIFPEYALTDLPPDSGVFAVDESTPPVKGIKAMGNGFRHFLFVPSRSWACAWQTYDVRGSEESFVFMQDLLNYATDGTPPRSSFARSTYAVPAASSRSMKAAYLPVGGTIPAYPNLMDTMDRLMQANYRVQVVSSPKPDEADVLWVSVVGPEALSEEAKQQMRLAMLGGRQLFIDVVSGNVDWDESFRAALAGLEPGIRLEKLRRSDPVFTGEIAGTQGFDVVEVPFRKALHDRFTRSGRCDLYDIYLNDRRVGIYSAYDISSGVGFHYFPGCRGPMPEASRQLATNMFLSVYAEKVSKEARADARSNR